ncbi:hypothetical protein BJ741DRAFT_604305 [Chytriomyces cf. hyalinus JEL632]|nr:hypothetical protein BJ741DRAFT_604305 [Chytriomyces cf. hyalinus JEL632]
MSPSKLRVVRDALDVLDAELAETSQEDGNPSDQEIRDPVVEEPEVVKDGIDSSVQESPEQIEPIDPPLPTIAPKPLPIPPSPALPVVPNEESQSPTEPPIPNVANLSSQLVETTSVKPPETVASVEAVTPSPQLATSEKSTAPETRPTPLSSETKEQEPEKPPLSSFKISAPSTTAAVAPVSTSKQSEKQPTATSLTKTSSSTVAQSTAHSSIPISSPEKLTSASVASTSYVAPLAISTTTPLSESNSGLIIGAVVGSVAALCLLALGFWRYRSNSSPNKSRSAAVTLAELANVNASPDEYAKIDHKTEYTYPRSSPDEFILADGSAARGGGTGQLGMLVTSSGASGHSAQHSPPIPSPQGDGDSHMWMQQQQQQEQQQQQQMLHYHLYQQQYYSQHPQQQMAWYYQNEQFPQQQHHQPNQQYQAWQQQQQPQWNPSLGPNTNMNDDQGSNPPPDKQ